MEKLSLCRICVSDELPLRSIVNTHLHEIYESLTKKPFVTEGNRPIVACDPCCASLEDCYELRTRCLNSEERFTQLLKSNVKVNKPMLPDTGRKRPLGDEKKIENDKVKEKQAGAARDDNSAHPDAESTEDVATVCRYIKVEIDIEHERSDDDTAGEQDEVELIASYNAPGDRSDDKPQLIGHEELHSDAGAPVSGKHIPNTQMSSEDTYSSRRTTKAIFEQISIADQSTDGSHNKPKTYSCDTCQKCFSCRSILMQHILTHTGEKPYQCNICKKCFRRKCSLNTHVLIHTGNNRNMRYKCVNRQDNLDVLIRTHTGEKPNEFSKSKQCLIRKREFNVHIRTHTSKKPYKCSMCERCFNHKHSFDCHIRTHTGEKPYQCNVCGRCFNRKDYLVGHYRTHTGEKPYQCNVCETCFSRKSNLNVHMRVHTDEKSYKCNMCKQYGIKKYELTDHIRTHTQIEP